MSVVFPLLVRYKLLSKNMISRKHILRQSIAPLLQARNTAVRRLGPPRNIAGRRTPVPGRFILLLRNVDQLIVTAVRHTLKAEVILHPQIIAGAIVHHLLTAEATAHHQVHREVHILHHQVQAAAAIQPHHHPAVAAVQGADVDNHKIFLVL